MTETPRCCKIGCDAPAEWHIHERGTTKEQRDDGYTEACTAHVGELLAYGGDPLPGRSQWFEVVPLPIDRDVAEEG